MSIVTSAIVYALLLSLSSTVSAQARDQARDQAVAPVICTVPRELLTTTRQLNTDMVRAYFTFGYRRGIEDVVAEISAQSSIDQQTIDRLSAASNAGSSTARDLSDKVTRMWQSILRHCSVVSTARAN